MDSACTSSSIKVGSCTLPGVIRDVLLGTDASNEGTEYRARDCEHRRNEKVGLLGVVCLSPALTRVR